MMDKCESCKFCEIHTKSYNDYIGFCHRYPPTLLPGEHCHSKEDAYDNTHYPAVSIDEDWCGEFKQSNSA